MKKFLAMLLVACFTLTAIGCSGGDKKENDKKTTPTPTPAGSPTKT